MADAAQGQAAPAAQGQAAPAAPTGDQRGIPDAVLRVQSIINAEEGPSPSKRIDPAQETKPAPQEQVPDQPEATPTEEAPAAPNKQVEGDDAPTEDARRVAEIPLDQLEAVELEVTVKGEGGKDITEKLPIKALREGYMRQQDYQRKTAEVARQRDAVGEQVRQAVEGERSAYQVSLQQVHDLMLENIAPELKNANWDDLAANNAFEFVRLTNMKDKFIKGLTQVQAKQKEIADKQKSEQDAARQKSAATARATLESDIPGWSDALYQTLMKSGEKHGYKPEEVATWTDARAIKLLHKAHQFDQLQAEKTAPSADKKVVVPPKVVRPGVAQNVNQRQQQDTNAMKKLQGSGKISDAADVIRSRLG